ncbi:hypothetical protein LVJ94_47815 [Pendulispora rubella]|uniref:Ketosynthase family 3 (KS3) domain-containing protein n=1 Tax=Pendulispora rubella TaxID=2741070 RepID=A0ABZ2LJA8_9BACT
MVSGRKIAVTGMGVVTPYGAGVDRFWQGIVGDQCAIRQSPRFSLSGAPTLSAPMPDAVIEDIERRGAGSTCRWAMARILTETLNSAGISESELRRRGRGAVFFSNHFDGDAHEDKTASREWRVDRWCAWLQDRLGAEEGGSVLTGCTASNMAIGLGFDWIAAGFCDWALVGGMDLLHDELLVEFESLRMLSQTGCRPFASDHDGTVLGDGAGLLLLENADRAEARGARPLAEMAGYGVANDITGLGKLDPEGTAVREAMERAIASAALRPSDVDCVNAGATGSALVDDAEVHAIARTFGEPGPTVYSVKPLIGHSIGGAGVVEAIATILSLERRWMPPALAKSGATTSHRLESALNNTIAMSGHICSTLFKRVPS